MNLNALLKDLKDMRKRLDEIEAAVLEITSRVRWLELAPKPQIPAEYKAVLPHQKNG